MKKLKEILLLLGLILVVLLLSLTLCFPAPFTAGSDTAFFGGIHYIRLLFCDKIFLTALKLEQTITSLSRSPWKNSYSALRQYCAA